MSTKSRESIYGSLVRHSAERADFTAVTQVGGQFGMLAEGSVGTNGVGDSGLPLRRLVGWPGP
jgi:hypothetical protein